MPAIMPRCLVFVALGMLWGCTRSVSETPTAAQQPLTEPPQRLAQAPAPAAAPPPLDRIKLPQGFRIAYYASDVPGARSLTRGDGGTIFVGTRGEGRVYALSDDNGDLRADRVLTILSGRNMPNGVAFRNGSLYVAEIQRVIRLDNIEERLDDPPQPVLVRNGFPSDRAHGWKFIAFGPDGMLYVPIGVPFNIGSRRDPYGTIMRLNPDGSGLQTFARGVRNSVGFDWHPETGELWFTDNGRDRMGDDVPPDELNHAPRAGLDFGFPYCHGRAIPDPQFGEGRRCDEFTPPARELGPHVAALGMRFYTGTMFPERYRQGLFIAEHGSWDRSVPLGYRVMYVPVTGNQATAYEVFAEGWLQGRNAWGRPVDVLVMPDGSLLVSDDQRGCVYRVSYG